MSKEDEENFENAKICWLCEQALVIKSHYISHYFKEKIGQNNIKNVPDSVII